MTSTKSFAKISCYNMNKGLKTDEDSKDNRDAKIFLLRYTMMHDTEPKPLEAGKSCSPQKIICSLNKN
jgi:hypothetical protein